MAILTASQMITEARTLALDLATTDPGLTDDQWLSRINANYLRWYELVEPRVKWQTQTLGLSAGANPLTSGSYSVTTTDKNISEVLEVLLSSSAVSADGQLLEKEELNNILGLVNSKPTPGTVQKWSAMRQAASSTPGAWTIYFWPPANSHLTVPAGTDQYLSIIVKEYPAVLTYTPDTTPDVTEAAAYTISRLAAVEGSVLLGRDAEFVSALMSRIPQDVQQSLQIGVKSYDMPRPRPDERPV